METYVKVEKENYPSASITQFQQLSTHSQCFFNQYALFYL